MINYKFYHNNGFFTIDGGLVAGAHKTATGVYGCGTAFRLLTSK